MSSIIILNKLSDSVISEFPFLSVGNDFFFQKVSTAQWEKKCPEWPWLY